MPKAVLDHFERPRATHVGADKRQVFGRPTSRGRRRMKRLDRKSHQASYPISMVWGCPFLPAVGQQEHGFWNPCNQAPSSTVTGNGMYIKYVQLTFMFTFQYICGSKPLSMYISHRIYYVFHMFYTHRAQFLSSPASLQASTSKAVMLLRVSRNKPRRPGTAMRVAARVSHGAPL